MFGVRVVIQPTAGLTFRRMPSSILHISTYPFLPPTTMSGFLRRLAMLSAGHLPDVESPQTRAKNPSYFVLPRALCAVGAYAEAWAVHTTKRHGIQSFQHDAFSRIHRQAAQKEVYQLHTWDYLMVERLVGYVLSEDKTLLQELTTLTNRGCKLGKEGYAFIAEVSEVTEWQLTHTTALPSTLVPASLLAGVPCRVFPLYRYAWKPDGGADSLSAPTPSPVAGFVPFVGGLVDRALEADYFTDGKAFVPKALVEELQREVT